jgi:hypothetical protein
MVTQLVKKLHLLWNLKVHCHIHKSLPLVSSWAKWIRSTPTLFKIKFNVILPCCSYSNVFFLNAKESVINIMQNFILNLLHMLLIEPNFQENSRVVHISKYIEGFVATSLWTWETDEPITVYPSPSNFTTDSQSVRLSWCRAPVSYCVTVSVLSWGGRPLWREGGSVLCQSLSEVIRQLSLYTSIYILHVFHDVSYTNRIYADAGGTDKSLKHCPFWINVTLLNILSPLATYIYVMYLILCIHLKEAS